MFKSKKNLNFINFNNAGSSRNSNQVIKTIKNYLEEEQNLGGYLAAKLNKPRILNFYRVFSNLINCKKSEISFLPSSTYGWNFFLNSIRFEKYDNVVIFENEYGNNFISLLKRKNLKVKVSKLLNNGEICFKSLEKNIDKNTKLVSVCHIASQCGDLIDVDKVGKVIKKKNKNTLFLLDACQSIGQIDINVKTINCDVMIGSGRKYLRGPRGTGFIFIKNDLKKTLLPIISDSYSCRLIRMNKIIYKKNFFETFEFSPALLLGLTTAVEQLQRIGMKTVEQKIKRLSLYFRSNLSRLKTIKIFENENSISGINTIEVSGFSSEEILNYLLSKKILCSISDKTTSYHFFKKKRKRSLVRFSFHYYNKLKEIDFLIKVLDEKINQ